MADTRERRLWVASKMAQVRQVVGRRITEQDLEEVIQDCYCEDDVQAVIMSILHYHEHQDEHESDQEHKETVNKLIDARLRDKREKENDSDDDIFEVTEAATLCGDTPFPPEWLENNDSVIEDIMFNYHVQMNREEEEEYGAIAPNPHGYLNKLLNMFPDAHPDYLQER